MAGNALISRERRWETRSSSHRASACGGHFFLAAPDLSLNGFESVRSGSSLFFALLAMAFAPQRRQRYTHHVRRHLRCSTTTALTDSTRPARPTDKLERSL